MHFNKAKNIYKKTDLSDVKNHDNVKLVKKVVQELIRSMNLVSENITTQTDQITTTQCSPSLVLLYPRQTSLDFEKAEKFCAHLFQIYEFCRKKLIDGMTKRTAEEINKAIFWLEEIFFGNVRAENRG